MIFLLCAARAIDLPDELFTAPVSRTDAELRILHCLFVSISSNQPTLLVSSTGSVTMIDSSFTFCSTTMSPSSTVGGIITFRVKTILISHCCFDTLTSSRGSLVHLLATKTEGSERWFNGSVLYRGSAPGSSSWYTGFLSVETIPVRISAVNITNCISTYAWGAYLWETNSITFLVMHHLSVDTPLLMATTATTNDIYLSTIIMTQMGNVRDLVTAVTQGSILMEDSWFVDIGTVSGNFMGVVSFNPAATQVLKRCHIGASVGTLAANLQFIDCEMDVTELPFGQLTVTYANCNAFMKTPDPTETASESPVATASMSPVQTPMATRSEPPTQPFTPSFPFKTKRQNLFGLVQPDVIADETERARAEKVKTVTSVTLSVVLAVVAVVMFVFYLVQFKRRLTQQSSSGSFGDLQESSDSYGSDVSSYTYSYESETSSDTVEENIVPVGIVPPRELEMVYCEGAHGYSDYL